MRNVTSNGEQVLSIMNLSDLFLDNIYHFSKDSFSPELHAHARKCLLDYLAATIAGSKEYRKIESAFLNSPIATGSVSSIIGYNKKSSSVIAALINGISAHAVELDDGQRFGNIHPGAPVISSLLAVGEAYDSSLESIINGILVGYEVTIRLACSIQPGHKLMGFHATGPCGTIGAALGIATMLGFSREQMKSTLSAACTSASGILEMIEGDTQMMPYNAGKAASNAVVSAMTGFSGFKSPEDPLGGKRGFLKCFADNVNLDILTNFSDGYYCLSNYFKPYAACGHCHASIEASLRLREKHLFRIDEIERIEVQTYKLALRGHDHTVIDGVNSARMSIPYAVATAITRGTAGIDDFGIEAINDSSLLELAGKVSVSENEELTRQAPSKRMAIVTVITKGLSYREVVTFPKGQPENPMSLDEIVQKFYDCGHFAGMSEPLLKAVEEMVFMNGDVQVSRLMSCLSC